MFDKFENFILIFLIFCLIFSVGCSDNFTPEQKRYIKQIEDYRIDRDKFIETDQMSAFNYAPTAGFAKFHPLNYFDVNFSFIFTSKFYQYPVKDTVQISKSRGRTAKFIRIGFILFRYKNKEYKLNIYKMTDPNNTEFYLGFKDKTNNKSTYKYGRYLNFPFEDDPNFLYTIDFNLAFNPDCAYNPQKSSYLPTIDNYLDIEITAGEKNFNN